jgi:hypothetical protein
MSSGSEAASLSPSAGLRPAVSERLRVDFNTDQIKHRLRFAEILRRETRFSYEPL